MRSIFTMIGVICFSLSAFANSGALSAEKFKAVADAAVTQYVVNEQDSIISISVVGKTSVSELFDVRALDSSGKCYTQRSNVFVSPEGAIRVSFPRMPRVECQ